MSHYSPLFPVYKGLGSWYRPTVKRVYREAYTGRDTLQPSGRHIQGSIPCYTPQGDIYRVKPPSTHPQGGIYRVKPPSTHPQGGIPGYIPGCTREACWVCTLLGMVQGGMLGMYTRVYLRGERGTTRRVLSPILGEREGQRGAFYLPSLVGGEATTRRVLSPIFGGNRV